METMSLEKWWELRENTFKEILVEGEDCILTYDKYADEYTQIQIIALDKKGNVLIEDANIDFPLLLNMDEVEITMRRK